MSAHALYRKYRPASFDEVIGQDHVVTVLKGIIASENIPHAYLFSGSRGTGKTTMARIFAQALKTTPQDIYEIDAASHRGIDDIRQLRDGVGTLPFDSPYKVYIIDEVHMLTKDAFNALLKTLEEPPAHVIFILATTEPEKILPTIISRCQRLDFNKPTQSMLIAMIERIAEAESYTLDAGVAASLALLGDGSFRDTQGVLQKVMSATTDTHITADIVQAVTHIPPLSLVHTLIEAIAQQDLDTLLTTLHHTVNTNIKMSLLVNLLLMRIRSILLIRYASSLVPQLEQEFTEEDFAFLKKMSTIEGKHINALVIKYLLEAQERMHYASLQHVPLELAFIELFGNNTASVK